MSSKKTRFIVKNALIASVYVVISVFFIPYLSFGAIQFRISEILAILPFFNPSLSIGVIIGCLITNFFSEFFLLDIFLGTLGTVLTVFFVSRSKSLFVATIWPVVFAIFPAIVISISTNVPLSLVAPGVMFSQFMVTFVMGYPFFKLLSKNEAVINKLIYF